MVPRDEGSASTAVRAPGFALPASGVDFRPPRAVKSQTSTVVTGPDIQALTRAARRGDAEAFARLYDLYSFRLYRFLLVLARGGELEARELCQAIFIKLAKRCDIFEDEGRLWAWLCVLAKNTFIDYCRKRQRLNRFVPFEEEWFVELSSNLSPEHQLVEILRETLAALPADERELIQAAYVDKRPLQELADEAGQTYKAVESRLGRLRQKLKEQLLKDLRHENEF
jgi:RNA polymerase sigma-70 factor (ECF subfamily)